MAWCHQATGHYLSQYWPRSLSPYDVTRPQWVNLHILINKWPRIETGVPTTCLLFKVVRWATQDFAFHYCDVIMGAIASQITSLTIVYSTVYSDADQRKHQSSASLAFVRGIHWGPVTSLHKWPVTRKMFPFDDVIMFWSTALVPKGRYDSQNEWMYWVNK